MVTPPMTHLFVCREFPPAAYPPGGIGTYVRHITDLLAQAGETVHVIAQRWDGAPDPRQELAGGRLIVHRVALNEPADRSATPAASNGAAIPLALLASTYPAQAFSWQAALLAERLVEREGVDVIEAQEWEAPLYYYQLRRALRIAPGRAAPCVVHLHSSSEDIYAANQWDVTVADYAPGVSLEEYSITQADAILCPSRFMAERAASRYLVDLARVHVIPHPVGDLRRLDRSERTWAAGSICHVGRLEPRKGVLEWVDAVSVVAAERADFTVEFVGGDMPLRVTGGTTVGEAIRARMPRHVRRHLRCRGSQGRDGVAAALSRAWAAVVPSRWENFPYSCVEAMCSGIPVIASPRGGLREMITDGVTGWLAPDATAGGLAEALRRALDTPASARERMGRAAADGIRQMCANDAILERHLAFKRDVASAGFRPPCPIAAAGAEQQRMALIVRATSDDRSLEACLASIRTHRGSVDFTGIVCVDRPMPEAASACRAAGWQIVQSDRGTLEEVSIETARALRLNERSIVGVTFVDARLRLESGALAVSRSVLAMNDTVGVVSGWVRETAPGDRVHVQPNPAAPHVLRNERAAPFVTVRMHALDEAARRFDPTSRQTLRDALDVVLEGGWAGVTCPAVVGGIALDGGDLLARRVSSRYSAMARALQRLHTPLLRWLRDCSAEERRALLREALRHPARSVRRLAGHAVRIGRAPRPIAAARGA